MTGEIQRDPRATESHSVVIPLAPTLLLRLALLSGARRFVVRIPCEASLGGTPWLTYSTVVVGSIDVTGVRAAVLPWEGWSPTSPAWMPFVPFARGTPVSPQVSAGTDGRGERLAEDGERLAEDHASAPQVPAACIPPDCGPGSVDGLIDLLLDLSGADVDAHPPARRAPSAKSRLRAVSVVGSALVQFKHTLDLERRAQLESLTPT